MSIVVQAIDGLSLVFGPFLLVGLITRVKAFWAGRRGPKLLQPLYDVLRLARKGSVISVTTTPLFTLGPIVSWVATSVALLFVPGVSGHALVGFNFDFVFVAYLLGLGRVALMLSALDTGSAFEGMGASRHATFATLAEPLFFLVLCALVAMSPAQSLGELLTARAPSSPLGYLVIALLLIACFVLLQVEAARMPVDDPTTHLELTMVHEVMVLDHSGPELAALQYAGALKLSTYAGLIAALLSPLAPLEQPFAAALATLLLTVLVAVAVGCVESLMARLRMRQVPRYLLLASLLACLCLAGASAWSR